MGINWTKLYELSNENNKISGSKFEKLVLDYLNQYYKEYDWKSTNHHGITIGISFLLYWKIYGQKQNIKKTVLP